MWKEVIKKDSDRDVILSWDATGYQKNMKFDKHSGELRGFAYDPESVEKLRSRPWFQHVKDIWKKPYPDRRNGSDGGLPTERMP